jgi:hypothetical protein
MPRLPSPVPQGFAMSRSSAKRAARRAKGGRGEFRCAESLLIYLNANRQRREKGYNIKAPMLEREASMLRKFAVYFAFWIWIALGAVLPSQPLFSENYTKWLFKTCNGYLLYNVHNMTSYLRPNEAGIEIGNCLLDLLPDNIIDRIITICGKPGMIDTKTITNPKSKCTLEGKFTVDPDADVLTNIVRICQRGRCYQFPKERIIYE